jgi:hypothetical protein
MTAERRDDWIDHDGKGLPVDVDEKVELRFRDGDTRVGRAGFWHSDGDEGTQWVFDESDPDYDIIAYRVVQA